MENWRILAGIAPRCWRARRLCDLVTPQWFSSDTYQLGYLGRGVHDSLTVGVPVSAMAEAYYGFVRMRKDDPFTEAQRDTALYAMRGLTWFHRQVMLAEGMLVASSPLSPTERRVLAQLLTDRPEKVIATELGSRGECQVGVHYATEMRNCAASLETATKAELASLGS